MAWTAEERRIYDRGYYARNRDRILSKAKVWQKNNPGRRAVIKRKYKYGLKDEDYRTMLQAQAQCCAICRKELPLFVDHSHQSSGVRGLLCRGCNSMIGFAGDCVNTLLRGASYLKTYDEG